MEQKSIYYQGFVAKELCWLLTSTLHYVEYVTFYRTLDVEKQLFEFFVSPDLEEEFLLMMGHLRNRGVVQGLIKVDRVT